MSVIHNDIYNMHMGNMNANEINLSFMILEAMSEQNKSELEINFDIVRDKLELKKQKKAYSTSIIIKTCEKMIKAYRESSIDGEYDFVNIFSRIRASEKQEKIIIKLNEEFRYLINVNTNEKGEKQKGYTIIENMREMYSLKSTYSKIIYMSCKKNMNMGQRLEMDINEFRDKLGIPDSYKMCNLNQRILEPAIEELKKYFPGLTVEKVKSGKGSKVTKLIFTWQRIEKKKKSTNKTIKEKPLKVIKNQGGEEEYKKYQELKSKENNVIDLIENLKEKKEIENNKPWITENELENMYQEWIKIEGVEDNKYTKKGYRLKMQGQFRILENKKAL